MTSQSVSQSRTNLDYINNLLGLAQSIDAQTTNALDVDDIYRSVVVLTVSTLDHYLHELVIENMMQIHLGIKPRTPHFDGFRVSLSAARQAAPNSTSWLEGELRERLSFMTFQRPDNIADAIRYISQVELWPTVATRLGTDVSSVKSRLALIVNRRNQIAHEADCIPGGFGARWQIDHNLTRDTVNFVKHLIEAIDACV